MATESNWLEASEQSFPASHPVAALISPLQEQPATLSPEERAERRLAALKKLAAINAFPTVTDPQAWQRDIRADRFYMSNLTLEVEINHGRVIAKRIFEITG